MMNTFSRRAPVTLTLALLLVSSQWLGCADEDSGVESEPLPMAEIESIWGEVSAPWRAQRRVVDVVEMGTNFTIEETGQATAASLNSAFRDMFDCAQGRWGNFNVSLNFNVEASGCEYRGVVWRGDVSFSFLEVEDDFVYMRHLYDLSDSGVVFEGSSTVSITPGGDTQTYDSELEVGETPIMVESSYEQVRLGTQDAPSDFELDGQSGWETEESGWQLFAENLVLAPEFEVPMAGVLRLVEDGGGTLTEVSVEFSPVDETTVEAVWSDGSRTSTVRMTADGDILDAPPEE
jgi:hypothetical protein